MVMVYSSFVSEKPTHIQCKGQLTPLAILEEKILVILGLKKADPDTFSFWVNDSFAKKRTK